MMNINITDEGIIPVAFFTFLSIIAIGFWGGIIIEAHDKNMVKIEMAKAGLIQKVDKDNIVIWVKPEK